MRLATYRSYRDTYSRDALRQMGLETSRDEVYPDLAFALPEPKEPESRDPRRTIAPRRDGVPRDLRRPGPVGRDLLAYVGKIVEFARRVVDEGYRIRLITGDPSDEAVVSAVIDDLRQTRPDLVDERVVREPADSLGELMDQLAGVDLVVASRYHNVQSALKLAKPTISISYGVKSDVLMEGMRLAEFRQPIRDLDVERLMDQLHALEARAGGIESAMREKNAEYGEQLERQFAVLSDRLFGAGRPVASGSDQ